MVTFGVSAQAAEANNCIDGIPTGKFATWGMVGRLVPTFIAKQERFYAQNCVNPEFAYQPDINALEATLTDKSYTGSVTPEAVFGALIKASQGAWPEGVPLPAMVSGISYDHFMVFGDIEVKNLPGKVLGTQRCPDTTLHENGGNWVDVTERDDEKYEVNTPNTGTSIILEVLRGAKERGDLPEDTKLICGSQFLSNPELRPLYQNAIYIEEGNGSKVRVAQLLSRDYAAATGWVTDFESANRENPEIKIWGENTGEKGFLAAGIFAYPKVAEMNKKLICGMEKSHRQATELLLQGSLNVKDGKIKMDKAGEKAFNAFKTAVLKQDNNYIRRRLVVMDGTSIDEEATNTSIAKAMEVLRAKVWTLDTDVSPDGLHTIWRWYKINDVLKKGFAKPLCTR